MTVKRANCDRKLRIIYREKTQKQPTPLLPSPRKFGRNDSALDPAVSEFVGRGAGGEGKSTYAWLVISEPISSGFRSEYRSFRRPACQVVNSVNRDCIGLLNFA